MYIVENMEWTLLLLVLVTRVQSQEQTVILDISPTLITIGVDVAMTCKSSSLNEWGAKWYMDGALVYGVRSSSGDVCSEEFRGNLSDMKINRTCSPNKGVFVMTILNMTVALNNTKWHCEILKARYSSQETLLVQDQAKVNLTITPVPEGSSLNMLCSSDQENDGVAYWYMHDRLVFTSTKTADVCSVGSTNDSILGSFGNNFVCYTTGNTVTLTKSNVTETLNNTNWHCDMNLYQPSAKISVIITKRRQAFLNASQSTVDFGGNVSFACMYSGDISATKLTWTQNNRTATELEITTEKGCISTTADTHFSFDAHCNISSAQFRLVIYDVSESLNDTTWSCTVEGIDRSIAVSNSVRIYVKAETTTVQVTETTVTSSTSNYTKEKTGSPSPSLLIPVTTGVGILLVVVIVAASVIACWRRAKRGADDASRQKNVYDGKKPVNRDSLVIQENELYCSSDNLTSESVQFTHLKDGGQGKAETAKQKKADGKHHKVDRESLVIQENELYCSSDNLTSESMQFTHLKDGGQGAADTAKQKKADGKHPKVDRESLVMQENELYCSSDNLTGRSVDLNGGGHVTANDSNKVNKTQHASLVLQENCLYESS